MCTDLGISKSILTDLKSGRKSGISTTNAKKIADYLGVSIDYLLEGKENPADVSADRADPMDDHIMDLVKQLTPDQRSLLLAQLKIVTDKK